LPSLLAWVDHDSAARERALHILSLFQERESRDELGLGAVRDAFADTLFPGTSTIQTHLKYMLFVPWIYMELEKQRVTAPKFAAKARQMEMGLVKPLQEAGEKQGVFGSEAGEKLKRLASSIYWNGLEMWGIRLISCSQDEYHRHIDEIYRLRDLKRRRPEKEDSSEGQVWTWHPKIPEAPQDLNAYAKKMGFRLTWEESSFILDRLLESQKESFLTHLALNCKPVNCAFPWQHPEKKSFNPFHQELLDYAELFSTVMHGAAILYNYMLAEVDKREELKEEHQENLQKWKEKLAACKNIGLPLDRLWDLTAGRGHSITVRTRTFVTEWYKRVLETRGNLIDDPECRTLIESREKKLKGHRSRFTNKRAREQWSGHAGTQQLSYRWPNVKTLLNDLYTGLKESTHA
jgi:hypothetical protein